MPQAGCCAGHGHHGMLHPFQLSSLLSLIRSQMSIGVHRDGPESMQGSTPMYFALFPLKISLSTLLPRDWLVARPCKQALSFPVQAGNPVVTIHGACHPRCPSRAGSAGIRGAADMAAWMPAVQRHMDASGVVPQLTVSLGHLPSLGSLLACSSSFSISCGAAGSRSPGFCAPGSSYSPDEACSSSSCSTGHSSRPSHHDTCQHSQSQQVWAVRIVSLALHVAILSLGLSPSIFGPPELCISEADATEDRFMLVLHAS